MTGKLIIDNVFIEKWHPQYDKIDKSKSCYYFSDTIRGYGIFRGVVADIAQLYPRWSLRQIDRTLFAYHKIQLKPNAKRCL